MCACRIIVDQRIYRKGRIGIATIVDVRDQLVELQHKVVRTGLHEFRESSSAALAASHAEELEQVQMPFPSLKITKFNVDLAEMEEMVDPGEVVELEA